MKEEFLEYFCEIEKLSLELRKNDFQQQIATIAIVKNDGSVYNSVLRHPKKMARPSQRKVIMSETQFTSQKRKLCSPL